MLNITLQNNAGKSKVAILNDDFDLKEFIKVVSEKMGPIAGYRFIIDGQQLDLSDEAKFNEKKGTIEDDKTIFVLDRLRGGGYLEMSTLIDIVLADLPDELKKLRKKNYQCSICMENTPCIIVCHGMVCDECFTRYFKSNNLQTRCVICRVLVPSKNIFITGEFIKTLRSLEDVKQLMKYIDCQICKCGALVINETMYPKQQCKQCSRNFCFFCNKDWNNDTMKNGVQFTCLSGNCEYETRVSFNLMPYMYSQHFQIPDRRCFPKCFNQGAHGDRCKYNTCLICNYEFCFLCLEKQPDCKRKYGGDHRTKCTDPIIQSYVIFPRLSNT